MLRRYREDRCLSELPDVAHCDEEQLNIEYFSELSPIIVLDMTTRFVE
jgi:hypothetical protein